MSYPNVLIPLSFPNAFVGNLEIPEALDARLIHSGMTNRLKAYGNDKIF